MGVSKNNSTPKSSILIGFSLINHPFWGTPIFGNIHIIYCINNSGGVAPCFINNRELFLGQWSDSLPQVSDQKTPSFRDNLAMKKYWLFRVPIASMYGIFTYICHILPLKTTKNGSVNIPILVPWMDMGYIAIGEKKWTFRTCRVGMPSGWWVFVGGCLFSTYFLGNMEPQMASWTPKWHHGTPIII